MSPGVQASRRPGVQAGTAILFFFRQPLYLQPTLLVSLRQEEGYYVDIVSAMLSACSYWAHAH